MRSMLVFVVFFFAFAALGIAASIERFDVPLGNSPQRGPKDAPITMIEFLDFQ